MTSPAVVPVRGELTGSENSPVRTPRALKVTRTKRSKINVKEKTFYIIKLRLIKCWQSYVFLCNQGRTIRVKQERHQHPDIAEVLCKRAVSQARSFNFINFQSHGENMRFLSRVICQDSTCRYSVFASLFDLRAAVPADEANQNHGCGSHDK